jgi:hypothetical protein
MCLACVLHAKDRTPPLENFRTVITGITEVTPEKPSGQTVGMSYNDAVLIKLGSGWRFLRGIEIDLNVPQAFFYYYGSLVCEIWTDIDLYPAAAAKTAEIAASQAVDLQGRQIRYEPLPTKIQTVYQMPLREDHGIKTSPYTVLLNPQIPSSYPLLFKITPVIKGMDESILAMRFQLTVRPIIGDEGAVAVKLNYPASPVGSGPSLQGRPVTVLIDDKVMENPQEEKLIKEGEHQLLIYSSDFRNENSRFVVERAKVTTLNVDLKDITPLLVFEAPEQAQISIDGTPLQRKNTPQPVEPGRHEVKVQVSDYTITKNITVQKGKTYTLSFMVDLSVTETE